jgi:dipeptidyl-peptidase 4
MPSISDHYGLARKSVRDRVLTDVSVATFSLRPARRHLSGSGNPPEELAGVDRGKVRSGPGSTVFRFEQYLIGDARTHARHPSISHLKKTDPMITRHTFRARTAVRFFSLVAVALATRESGAQDRLKLMPGYDRYQKIAPEIFKSVSRGTVSGVKWLEGGKGFEYTVHGKFFRFDMATMKSSEIPAPPPPPRGNPGRGPDRGRQWNETASPTGKLKAYYKNRNLWISNADGSGEYAVTTEGSEAKRTKFGTGSWVYGEELYQTTAMWWSPDGTKLAYYGFDESKVKDFYLQMDQTKIQGSLDVEAYPKAGTDNPVVDLFVYDLATKKSTRIDARDGKPLEESAVGYYVYKIGWTPDGNEVTLNRTNRRQNVMEFAACAPATGKCRVVVREEWPASWVENLPPIKYLADGKRFLWVSERSGFANIYLYELTGKLIAPLTQHEFEVDRIVNVDEKAGLLWYNARSGDNHMKMQLHRVGLDGKGDKRLTDPAFHHNVELSPDSKYMVDVIQTHDQAPVSRLLDADGKVVAELAKSDMSKFEAMGLQKVEMFTFTAADGTTKLHGMIERPSNFDPSKKYPVLLSVYAGPATNGASENFALPSGNTELGFIVLRMDARSVGGRGKKILDALYLKLGVTEIDDLAAGVKSLWDRPYIDKNRVGIYGTSYGGYASAIALVRYPDVFQAAVAGSPVTDWRHYDTIYTERYMWTPQENTAGYDAGSVMTYVDKLRGRLMIYYGTADNNVHPNNSMQLIKALQKAKKSFEVQVGPDEGHSGLDQGRMLEFFIENLVLWPAVVGGKATP